MITSKEKSYDHVVISGDADKEFDKIQHQLMIKNSVKGKLQGDFLNLMKCFYKTKIL